jgi:hypothetical protein
MNRGQLRVLLELRQTAGTLTLSDVVNPSLWWIVKTWLSYRRALRRP